MKLGDYFFYMNKGFGYKAMNTKGRLVVIEIFRVIPT